jgi:anti-sigma factor RsiW
MTSPSYPTEDELHAYIDDELTASRRTEIAAILRQDPALAERVAAYQGDRDRLRTAFASFVDEPPPAVWVAQIETAMAAPKRSFLTRRFAIAGGATGMALAASVAAYIYWRAPRDPAIVTEAEAARAGHLAGRIAGNEPLPPPATRDTLLQSALGMRVRAPDLQRYGFQLTRMELFGATGAGAAQLQYADAGKRMLTIYVRASDGTVHFDIVRRGATRVCVWQDDVVGAVIIAPLSAAEMLHIASSAYTDLNL